MNTIQNELDQVKDTSIHQKKRVTDLISSLLKDLGDVGAIVGGNASDTKVKLTDFLQKTSLVVN